LGREFRSLALSHPIEGVVIVVLHPHLAAIMSDERFVSEIRTTAQARC